MNQADLVNAIAEHHSNTGVSKAAIKFVLDAQADVIKGALNSGDQVTLLGLGKLSVSDRAARTARNPRTGEEVAVPAKKAPKFDAIKALKDAVNA